MSFKPLQLVMKLASDPELAMISTLDAALKQTACALLAQHQDIDSDQQTHLTAVARSIIDSCWSLQRQLRRYRAALRQQSRHRSF